MHQHNRQIKTAINNNKVNDGTSFLLNTVDINAISRALDRIIHKNRVTKMAQVGIIHVISMFTIQTHQTQPTHNLKVKAINISFIRQYALYKDCHYKQESCT